MKLSTLIKEIQYTRIVLPKEERDIKGISIDSRSVKEGYAFVAIRGTQVDGHQFITAAEEKEAAAIICETIPESLNPTVAYVQVPDAQAVVGKIATTFYGNPTNRIKLVGVTGTNGKTTIATLLYKLFRKMGHKCGLISTVCNYIDGTAYPTTHTTPDAVTLNALLGQMADEGCEYAFITRNGTRTCRRTDLYRRHIHQPDTRPHRLSRDNGQLSESKKKFFRYTAA